MAICATVQTEAIDVAPTTQAEPSRGGEQMIESVPSSDVFNGTERVT